MRILAHILPPPQPDFTIDIILSRGEERGGGVDNFIIQTLAREFRSFYENLSNLTLKTLRFDRIFIRIFIRIRGLDEIRKDYEGV